jgi:hypothetical protein
MEAQGLWAALIPVRFGVVPSSTKVRGHSRHIHLLGSSSTRLGRQLLKLEDSVRI